MCFKNEGVCGLCILKRERVCGGAGHVPALLEEEEPPGGGEVDELALLLLAWVRCSLDSPDGTRGPALPLSERDPEPCP